MTDTTTKDVSFYAQDQFRWTPRLTLNYGVRYEYATYTQPSVTNPDYPATGRIPTVKTNFAPRIGLAYSLRGGKTVVRAGYGIFYARYPTGLIQTLINDNGAYTKEISLNGTLAADLALGPVFPNRLPGIDRTPPAGTVDLTMASADLRNPYTQQGDIGLENQLTRDLGLTVSYLWSRGLHLWTRQDINIGPQGAPVTYRINDASGNQVGSYTTPTYRLANRVDTRWRRVLVVDNGGNTYYNAMAVQLRKRFSKGWQGNLSYTWSHAIDYNQGGGTNNIFFSAGDFLRSTFNGDYRGDKGSSLLDQRHRLTMNFIASPTFTKSDGGVARYLVNNWQLSGILTMASSHNATTTLRVSGSPFTGAANTSTLNGFGGANRVPWLPYGNLDIDKLYRLDARLTKILPFTERYKLYINFEAFNVFNHKYFTAVNTEAFSATAGVISPTARVGLGSQAQGFPDGTSARRAQLSFRFVF